MPRGLDHIVHAVRDLDVAAAFYRRAGFQVGARNRHPWGTHNHVVQFPGFFIEILTVAEPDKLGDDGLSQRFGIPGREAIERGDGLAMLVLESTDSEADVADFARSGIGISQPLPFSREAALPNGRATTVGFSLVFVKDAQSPDTTFFTCRQHNPAAFWKPDYQVHPNGATGVRGAVLVAASPADHRGFLAAWTGVRDVQGDEACITAPTPRGEIALMTPGAFSARFGVAVVAGEGLSIRGLRLAVRDLGQFEAQLRAGGIAHHRQTERVVIAPDAAAGAMLVFEEAAAS